jgi:hypothetical protein
MEASSGDQSATKRDARIRDALLYNAAMFPRFGTAMQWLFGPGPTGASGHLKARWLFLRALGLIYCSAFYSLLFQIRGLIGPSGILPAREYLDTVSRYMGTGRFWFAPTLFWIRSSDAALMAGCWAGLIASIAVVLNLWPRAMLFVCFVTFLSFVAGAQDFAGYQSDGMLLEAGFIALLFAPDGFRPGIGATQSPSRAGLFLLQWEWFRIYFESGVAKIASGDLEWRHLTAMDEYYQNGPLPTWVGWYMEHLPHRFHMATAAATLLLELVVVWMLFLPRRFRIICFWIVTPWEIAVILTANYTFLNYLVLALGILLLDDGYLERWRLRLFHRFGWKSFAESAPPEETTIPAPIRQSGRNKAGWVRVLVSGFLLTWIFYATTVQLIGMVLPRFPLPEAPVRALDPFGIANQYGLFAVMTLGRYEIEFQGSNDGGQTWTPYPYRYKPQATNERPRIYAPYQPRLDWNLWFASLGNWRDSPLVLLTEERLLENSPRVLALFAGNPFEAKPPQRIRAVVWQYWFTDMATKRATGEWWRRKLLGLYAPVLERQPDGRVAVVGLPPAPPL